MPIDVRLTAPWRKLIGRADPSGDPRSWRERLLDVTLAAAFLLGILTALPGITVALSEGDWAVVLVDGAALAWVGTITVARTLPYRFRAWSFLLLVYVLGSWFLVTVGALSQTYLMSVPIFAALLLGLGPAIGAIVLNAATTFLLGYFLAPGISVPAYDDSPALKWLLVSLNLTFLSAVVTVGISYLLRRLEVALGEQRRITAAIEQAGEAVLLGALDGRVEYANAAGRDLLRALPTTGPDSRLRLQDLVRPLQGPLGTPTSLETDLPWEGEIELSGEDGAPRQLRASVSPLHEDAEEVSGFVAVLQDVTRERRMEVRVRSGERLEALGTLAGGVAHDFNNIVGSILGLVDDVRSRAPSPAIAASLDAIVRACVRAREVVRQMMVFARKAPLERRPLLVRDAVEEALALVRSGTPAGIDVKSALESPARALVGEAEIHQLLMNLCTNAVQAMGADQGGTLSIRLWDADPPPVVPSDAGELAWSGAPTHVCLSVTDTGTGIPTEHLPRIFDPFFTTKGSTQGTGLGLASVYGIVRSMGGEIRVYSEVGSGTTFRLYLPHASCGAVETDGGDADTPPEESEQVEEIAHVLLVDDEEVLRRMTARTLRRLGHEVTEAGDGLSALEILEERLHDFDLVLTDLTMPRMGGAELVRRLRELEVRLPVVLTSGFADTPEGRTLDGEDGITFLSKPYTRGELAHAVAEALRIDAGEDAPS